MDKDIKISLGVSALGAGVFFYGRNNHNGNLAKNSAMIGLGGLGYAAIKSIYNNRNNPKTWAITAIPIGVLMVVVAGASGALSDGGIDEKAKVKLEVVASTGAALAFGGATFLLTKNKKTSAIVALLGVAAIMYAYNYETTQNNNKKGNENQTDNSQINTVGQ